MKTVLFIILSVFLLFTAGSTVMASTYTFDYGGYLWGTMDIDIYDPDANILSITYTASASIPPGSQATGFGFSLENTSAVVSNAPDPDTNLEWVKLKNLNAIPNPANDPSVKKRDFNFGVTEGNQMNFTPSGILPGNSDTFYLTATSDNLAEFVDLVGVRLQSIPNGIHDGIFPNGIHGDIKPNCINGGSLFLVGSPSPVPIPGSLWLLCSGLIGLIGVKRKLA